MSPEQLAKMHAGRNAAQALRQAEARLLELDESAQFTERHERARQDLIRGRGPEWAS